MVTRQEADEAIREHTGQGQKPGAHTLIDGGDGRWLVIRAGGHLAVDQEGRVRPVGEVFSSDEYWRLSAGWAF